MKKQFTAVIHCLLKSYFWTVKTSIISCWEGNADFDVCKKLQRCFCFDLGRALTETAKSVIFKVQSNISSRHVFWNFQPGGWPSKKFGVSFSRWISKKGSYLIRIFYRTHYVKPMPYEEQCITVEFPEHLWSSINLTSAQLLEINGNVTLVVFETINRLDEFQVMLTLFLALGLVICICIIGLFVIAYKYAT